MVPRPLGEQLRASKPREIVHFDFLKMAITEDTTGPAEYILMLKDGFCAFCLLFPCQAANTAATVAGLMQWFSLFGPESAASW